MEKYIILGHENPDFDSIISGYLLEKLMCQRKLDAEFIIPDKTIAEENFLLCNYCNINPSSFQKTLPKDPNIKYILVDHHERDVPGEIVAIIDHHPTDQEISCPYYQNERACSTSCLIAKDRERRLTLDDLKATCLSAMVDTAAFHSDKTTIRDYTWVKYLCKRFDFNYNELATLSMCPTDISNKEKACLNGLKTYEIYGHKVASSYLHITNPKEKDKEIQEMIAALQTHLIEDNYHLFAFIVHDITSFKTTLYKIQENTTETIEYDQYTSRGTKIIPDITNELKSYQKKKTIE